MTCVLGRCGCTVAYRRLVRPSANCLRSPPVTIPAASSIAYRQCATESCRARACARCVRGAALATPPYSGVVPCPLCKRPEGGFRDGTAIPAPAVRAALLARPGAYIGAHFDDPRNPERYAKCVMRTLEACRRVTQTQTKQHVTFAFHWRARHADDLFRYDVGIFKAWSNDAEHRLRLATQRDPETPLHVRCILRRTLRQCERLRDARRVICSTSLRGLPECVAMNIVTDYLADYDVWLADDAVRLDAVGFAAAPPARTAAARDVVVRPERDAGKTIEWFRIVHGALCGT